MSDAPMSLAGRRVVVIGGASGIGFAVAALAKEIGAEVVIASRNAAKVAAAVERLPGAHRGCKAGAGGDLAGLGSGLAPAAGRRCRSTAAVCWFELA